MSKKEARFEKDFLEKVQGLDRVWVPFKMESLSVRGIPDRIFCVNGIFVAIEFKKDKKEATKNTGRIRLQRYILEEIAKAGGYTAIVSPDNAVAIFDDLKRISRRGGENE